MEEIISRYSDQEALEDGSIFDITKLNKAWENGLFNYVTLNLLSKGYIKQDGGFNDFVFNIPNILDLLNQANNIVKTRSNNFKDFDSFFKGIIELPDGIQQEIFIGQNETGKFSLMLPEDY